MVAGFTSEQWPDWPRNGGRIASEYAIVEWLIEDKGQLVLQRMKVPPSARKKKHLE